MHGPTMAGEPFLSREVVIQVGMYFPGAKIVSPLRFRYAEDSTRTRKGKANSRHVDPSPNLQQEASLHVSAGSHPSR